jgi:hypothetical protein
MRNRASTILKASALRAHMHRRPPSVLHTKALESGNTLRLARPVMILAPILGAVGLTVVTVSHITQVRQKLNPWAGVAEGRLAYQDHLAFALGSGHDLVLTIARAHFQRVLSNRTPAQQRLNQRQSKCGTPFPGIG